MVEERFEDEYDKSLQIQTESMSREVELLKQEASNSCKFFENSGEILSAINKNDRDMIKVFSNTVLESFNIDLFMVIKGDGNLFYRSDLPDESGNSMLQDFEPFNQAMKGSLFNDLYLVDNKVLICATSPVYDANGTIIATVTIGYDMSAESFVDYYSAMTDHDITIFANKTRSMTTLKDATGNRLIGTELKDTRIIEEVFEKHNSYYGKTVLQESNYICSYTPILNTSSDVIILFLGKNLTEVEKSALDTSKTLGIIVAIITIISLIIILFFIYLYVKRPMKILTQKLNEIKASGSKVCNLTIRVPETSKDEIGEVGRRFNILLDEISSIIQKITDVHRTLISASETLAASSEETSSAVLQVGNTMYNISDTATKQSQKAGMGAEKINNLSKNLSEVVIGAEDMKVSSSETENVTEEGLNAVKSLEQSSKENNEMLSKMADKIAGLNEKSKEIDNILVAIKEIAAQTNLLALNASIEAARAGEAGLGFGVVAGEVGALADQSEESTKIIQKLVFDIQSEIEDAVKLMENVTKTFHVQSKIVQTTQESFQHITISVKNIIDRIELVSSSLSEIEASKTELVDSIHVISSMSKSTSKSTEEITDSVNNISSSMEEIANLTQTLNQVSQELKENIATFIL